MDWRIRAHWGRIGSQVTHARAAVSFCADKGTRLWGHWQALLIERVDCSTKVVEREEQLVQVSSPKQREQTVDEWLTLKASKTKL